jgi:hypothetical protein
MEHASAGPSPAFRGPGQTHLRRASSSHRNVIRRKPTPLNPTRLLKDPAERIAWAFYVIAAIGSAIGQIWVGVSVLPWPATVPLPIRVLLVAPFAVVIDFFGVVASAFADWRQSWHRAPGRLNQR